VPFWLAGWLAAQVLHMYETDAVSRWSVRVSVCGLAFLLLVLLDQMGLSIVVVIAIVLFNNEIGPK
jgi:hypothetical protein